MNWTLSEFVELYDLYVQSNSDLISFGGYYVNAVELA
jgi:hypothetical protein